MQIDTPTNKELLDLSLLIRATLDIQVYTFSAIGAGKCTSVLTKVRDEAQFVT